MLASILTFILTFYFFCKKKSILNKGKTNTIISNVFKKEEKTLNLKEKINYLKTKILNDLEESFKIFKIVIEKINNEKYSGKKIIKELKNLNSRIIKFKEELKLEIGNKDIFKIFEKIIDFLKKNNEKFIDNKIKNLSNELINRIVDLNDKIYFYGEKKRLKNKEVEKKYEKIGEEKLKKLLELEPNLKEEIEKYLNTPTFLKFNFIKLKKSGKYFKEINILGDDYNTEKNIEIQYKERNGDINYFETQTTIKLRDKSNEKNNIEFTLNINLHQINNYNIFIDIFEEKTYSLEIIFYSKINKLLPKQISINGLFINITDFLYSMARVAIFNINKKSLTKFFEQYPDYCKTDASNQYILFNYTDIFVNIFIINKTKNNLKIYNNYVDIISYEYNTEDVAYINECYNKIFGDLILEKIDISELISKFKKGFKNKKKNIKKILKVFNEIPYFIKYRKNIPSNEDIELIEKICILQIIFNDYPMKTSDYILVLENLKYFIQFKKSISTINENKTKLFVLLNITKYILKCNNKDYNYKMIYFKNLPEYSPYVQSEILYRKIISSLEDKSKLSLLFLQLNSGGGTDIISLKKWYKVKMIPLIAIKFHILNNFSPYFFIYESKEISLAFVNPQTLLKSFNEYFLKIGEEQISLHESSMNTSKILILNCHEYSHINFKGNKRMETSPQFALKNNLLPINNDYNISHGILKGDIFYKNKNYLKNLKYFQLSEESEEDYEEEEESEDCKEENEDINFEENKIFDDNYDISEKNEDDNENYEIKEDEDNEFLGTIIKEAEYGESGFLFEYYICNNYFCSNGIVRYKGNLNKLLQVELYTKESLIELKKYIESKIRIWIRRNPKDIVNNAYSINIGKLFYKKKRKSPDEPITYADVGILVNE